MRSVSLIVLCIFAKRFVLSVSGFLSQRNFCTTAVLLWGTHWGAVSWIVLFFSCRAIPRARFGPSELGLGRPSLEVASPSGASGYRELGQAQFGGQILITLRISASTLKDFRLVWRGESEYCSGGSIDVRLEQLALTNVPLLPVFVLIYRWGWRMLWTLCL